MDELRRDIREAFARQQAGLRSPREVQERLLRQALSTAGTRRNWLPQLAGGAATLLVAGAVAIAVLLTHGQLRQEPSTQANSIEQALSAGPPAMIGPTSDRAFVWLTGTLVQPQGKGNQGGQWAGVTVNVLDWTGQVRYHFQLPHSTLPQGFNEIQAISADGTRALLDDGTVLDETGAAIGKIPSLKSDGPAQSHVRWMSDDSGVCAALSNADHSVTLKIFGLDRSIRTVATVGSGALSVASGNFPDTTSVLACNPTTDLAVVARYHDADNTAAGTQPTTNMTVSLWAVKLSTGATLFHQPETRMALGRPFFFGSENGRIVVEFLWNSKVWGSETDLVLQIPSGHPVPVLDAEPIPDTPGLSADGTRILRRLVDKADGQTALERIVRWLVGQADEKTDLEVIDATSGRVIRRVVVPGIVGASAVAQPDGSSFMVQFEGYLALVDRDGGISVLHPAVNLAGPNGVGLSEPGVQG